MKPFKIKVGEREYQVSLPPYKFSYLMLLADKIAGKPRNFQEAKQFEEDIKNSLEELKRCFTPEPSPEDLMECILKAIAEATNELNRASRAAGFSIKSTDPVYRN